HPFYTRDLRRSCRSMKQGPNLLSEFLVPKKNSAYKFVPQRDLFSSVHETLICQPGTVRLSIELL
ncbi:hypothetical protein LR021_04500, partial [Candidatus Bipolaricaulota bacterium]|nr:hypothetical protein [Candidatus Bipolaricaulota bacterium]